jgi:hypothetical protein
LAALISTESIRPMSEARISNQGGFDERLMIHGHNIGLEIGFHCLNAPLIQIFPLLQETEGCNHDPIPGSAR